jgi:hypothetical protein
MQSEIVNNENGDNITNILPNLKDIISNKKDKNK